MLRLMLPQAGWQVEMAEDGEEAVEKWRHGEFDLILMDLQMPRLDGLAATRRIRALEQGQKRRTCIIALTAHAGHEAREQCEAAGMDDFVAKPVRAPELFSALTSCLAGRERSA
jgi:CheY-like chemotaxis protein